MERRLFEASLTGDVHNLHQLLIENPLALHTVALASSGNPLHVASAYGHVDFVKEILRLRPDFAKELNADGFSPMHIASANGHLEVIRELQKVDQKLCRLQGQENKTPLHLAVIKGRVDVIKEILSACGECMEDVTVERETPMHLAIKSYQFEAIRVMLDWIREMKEEYVLNMKDEHGNTTLHLATWKKQRQVIEMLIGLSGNGLLEVNAINQTGLTALDLLLMFPSEAGNGEIQEILRNAGAVRARDVTLSSIPSSEPYNQTTVNSPITPETCGSRSNDPVEYFKFKKGRDSPGETRTALLVIAVLVATATFQVGVNPPGGVWQDNYIPDRNNGTTSSTNKAHRAGSSILGTENVIVFGMFMVFNSIGFTLSLHMINMLTIKFPLQLELQICMTAMFFTYGTAVPCLAPNNLWLLLTLVTSILPAITPVILNYVRKHVKKLRVIRCTSRSVNFPAII